MVKIALCPSLFIPCRSHCRSPQGLHFSHLFPCGSPGRAPWLQLLPRSSQSYPALPGLRLVPPRPESCCSLLRHLHREQPTILGVLSGCPPCLVHTALSGGSSQTGFLAATKWVHLVRHLSTFVLLSQLPWMSSLFSLPPPNLSSHL